MDKVSYFVAVLLHSHMPLVHRLLSLGRQSLVREGEAVEHGFLVARAELRRLPEQE